MWFWGWFSLWFWVVRAAWGVGLRVWIGLGIGLVWCLVVTDRVGVGDAEDLGGGEADGLGVCWAGWVLCGDVFEGAEGGRAPEGVGGGAACLFDRFEAGRGVLERR